MFFSITTKSVLKLYGSFVLFKKEETICFEQWLYHCKWNKLNCFALPFFLSFFSLFWLLVLLIIKFIFVLFHCSLFKGVVLQHTTTTTLIFTIIIAALRFRYVRVCFFVSLLNKLGLCRIQINICSQQKLCYPLVFPIIGTVLERERERERDNET